MAQDVVVFKGMEFRSHNGMISCTDNRDTPEGRGSKTWMQPEQLRERLTAVGYARKRKRDGQYDRIRRDENPHELKTFDLLWDLSLAADHFGCPLDQTVRDFKLRHKRGAEQILRKLMEQPHPGLFLPDMPLGEITGRTAVPDRSLADRVLADCALAGNVEIYRPATKKPRTALFT